MDVGANRVTLTWQPNQSDRADQSEWPLAEINGLRLPAQLFAFAATGPTPPRLHIKSLTSQPTGRTGSVSDQPPPAIPQTVDGPPRPDLAAIRLAALPDTPVSILRRGRMRGVELLVVAVAQRFAQDGQPQTLTSLTFSLDGAQPLERLATPAALATQPFALDTISAPSPLASQPRVRVDVQSAGMQEIRLDDLRGLGFVDNNTPLARLQLYWDGQPVALEESDDRLRFYAPAPGDRWNASTTYSMSLS